MTLDNNYNVVHVIHMDISLFHLHFRIYSTISFPFTQSHGALLGATVALVDPARWECRMYGGSGGIFWAFWLRNQPWSLHRAPFCLPMKAGGSLPCSRVRDNFLKNPHPVFHILTLGPFMSWSLLECSLVFEQILEKKHSDDYCELKASILSFVLQFRCAAETTAWQETNSMWTLPPRAQLCHELSRCFPCRMPVRWLH